MVIKFNQAAWKHQKQKLEMERYFLQWTEQQRMAMDPQYLAPIEENRELSNKIRKFFVSCRRKRQSKTCSVLGKPKISKQKQKSKIPNTASKSISMDFSPPTNNVSPVPDNSAPKLGRVKTQTPRHQPSSQNISKAKRLNSANARSRAVSQKRRSSDTQSLPQFPSSQVEVMTHSGRVSRPPVKWVPV